ncbi:hypothetical protein [Amycolatopsis regifaucium]|uniref:Uncharacterized protein n=1 Tax=Amycolatopsis regifaucium TaxID=546365 RepID=A0A154M4A7_9PSEU|nr:hypothetical protein [Amycolatopsis regifaucium]KZB79207.1 hypothetical protein AVL48_16535 [Amycolatopsis regifaucium]OKA07390.1 hypothetical protein ATP06_0216215 [Amycolatopsis regifaucium]SFH12600.1 hypothetical protein SAMN04489731_102568 [Amycolatopsis regifaucium]
MTVRIYWTDPLDGYHWINPVDSDDFKRLRFDGTSRASSWEPVKMELVTEDSRGAQTSDEFTYFPWSGSDRLMLRDEAIEKVGPLLEPYGEILPLEGDGFRVSVFNCTTVVDALDEDESEIAYFRSSGRLQEIRSYVFRAKDVEGLGAFTLTQQPGKPVLFTDALIDELAGTGLSALCFTALWDSEEGTYGERLATEFRSMDRKI